MIRVPFIWNEEHRLPQCAWESTLNNIATVPVEVQQKDPGSLLNHYKKLIRARQTSMALMKGSFAPISAGNRAVIAYERNWTDGNERENVIVLHNISGKNQLIRLDISMSDAGVLLDSGDTAIASNDDAQAGGTVVEMSPLSTLVIFSDATY